MSARAAWRLESLGFTQVYRYTAGKVDWFASGLPREGEFAHDPRAGDLSRRDAPTCRLTDSVDAASEGIRRNGWTACVVVNDRNIVLGLLRASAADGANRGQFVEEVMEPGPTTFRPHVPPDEPLTYMQRHDVDSVVVTTSDGELVGLLRRDDVERAQRPGRK